MTTLFLSFVAGLFVGCMLGILVTALCHMSRLAEEDDRADLLYQAARSEQEQGHRRGLRNPFADAGKPIAPNVTKELPEGTP